MGGCITPANPKKNHTIKNKPEAPKTTQRNLNDDTANILNDNNAGVPVLKKRTQAVVEKPKFRKMNGQQFCGLYRIEQYVGNTCRVEGPKYINNFSDGTGKVLRVIPFGVQSSMTASTKDPDPEKRLKVFSQLLGLEIYEDDESNLLVLQDYYCGPFIHQLACNQQAITQNRQLIINFLTEIYNLIDSFHQKGVTLGNITIFSFRQTSNFDSSVKMVELNLLGQYDEAMGHAFKAERAMDWESFAFIVQSVMNLFPPVFIPHKIQYVDNSNEITNSLLRGKKIKKEDIENLKFRVPSKDVINGYRFRSDINKLLKLRKKRFQHRKIYYSEDVFADGQKNADDVLQRMETVKIFERIQGYIGQLNPQCEQAFLMYSTGNQSLKKLKAIFTINDANKKMDQLKETLHLIK